MARLPQPGGDDGNWGIILNEYLRQIHTESGDLKPSTVGKDAIQNAAITEDKLASPLVAKINAIPTGGAVVELRNGLLRCRLRLRGIG